MLRRAKVAPLDTGLGLVAQDWRLEIGPGICGAGHLQAVDGGPPRRLRRWLVRQGQRVVPAPARAAPELTATARLEARESEPWWRNGARGIGRAEALRRTRREGLGDTYHLESRSKMAPSRSSTPPPRRNARASVRIAVDLAIAARSRARRRCCASGRAT